MLLPQWTPTTKINIDFHTDFPLSSCSGYSNMVISNPCNPLTVVVFSTIISRHFPEVIKLLLFSFRLYVPNKAQINRRPLLSAIEIFQSLSSTGFCNIFLCIQFYPLHFNRLIWEMKASPHKRVWVALQSSIQRISRYFQNQYFWMKSSTFFLENSRKCPLPWISW